MGLRNLRLVQSSLLAIFLFCYTARTFAQNDIVSLDSIFSKIMDSDLKPVSSKKIIRNQKPVIVVSISHCSACVKYFAESQKNYQFVFLMNNESLLEVNRITNFYKLKSGSVYFSTVKDVKSKIQSIVTGATPVAINHCKEGLTFMDYPLLNAITQEFTLDHWKVKNALKECQ